MFIISHRGFWLTAEEKNTESAFIRSFSQDIGTETDIRDYNGELVISHDIADDSAISFKKLLTLYCDHVESYPPLALNVKADSLQARAKVILQDMGVKNYFFFDMSIPDSMGYLNIGLNFFVRMSEYEDLNDLYEKSQGVWLDGFNHDIATNEVLSEILNDGKKVCIVSPELHNRSHLNVWAKYSCFDQAVLSSENLMICTDYPQECMGYFNEYTN